MPLQFLIDTDVCVAALDDEPAVRRIWEAKPVAQIALCSLVRGELEAGAWGSRDPHNALAKVSRLFGVHVSKPFDDRAAAEYGRITGDLRRAGREIGVADTMIAAIALAHSLTVVTRNVKHFMRVKDLDVIRW